MIKKYNEFLNSLSLTKLNEDNNEDKIKTLSVAINEIISDTYGSSSFTSIAHSISHESDDIFANVNSLLESNFNIKLKDIKNYIKSREDFITLYDSLNEIGGYFDLYLYYLEKHLKVSDNVVELGGLGFTNYTLSDPSEIYIKYSYGYHRFKYGKLFVEVLKNKYNVNFEESAIKYLEENIRSNFDSELIKYTYDYDDKRFIIDEYDIDFKRHGLESLDDLVEFIDEYISEIETYDSMKIERDHYDVFKHGGSVIVSLGDNKEK